MKKFMNMVIGGLQQKIFNLVLISMLLVAAAFQVITVYQSNQLKELVAETNTKQKDSITAISSETMDAVVTQSLSRTTQLEASAADNVFSQLKAQVMLLKDYAENLYASPQEYTSVSVKAPDAEKDGTVSVQLLSEEGVNLSDAAIAQEAGLLGNLSNMMYSLFDSSEYLNSCFIGTSDGIFIIADNRSGDKINEDGSVVSFPVRQRPWYTGAIAAGDIWFSDIEVDAFTGELGIVCSMPVYQNGKAVAVVGADLFLSSMNDIFSASQNESGYITVINSSGHVLYASSGQDLFRVETDGEIVDVRQSENTRLAQLVTEAMQESTEVIQIAAGDSTYYMAGSPLKTIGWTLISFIDRDTIRKPTVLMEQQYNEILAESNEKYSAGIANSVKTGTVLLILIIATAIASALMLAKQIVKPIGIMTDKVSKLKGSDLAFKMEDVYKTDDEIEVLAQSFADLSERTLVYIDEIRDITSEKERISTELNLANRIQADMLPSIFPAFPEKNEFDIFADMKPAKEVGGDFYDYFLIDDDHLGLVIADVSGKGIPAALFMMASKIIISNYAMQGLSPKEVLEKTNGQICRTSQEDMFVTVWFGILELSTGKVTASNAGHEYPVIRHKDGRFELYKDKHGFVIGGMDGVFYTEYEFKLEPDSILFLYTDGVCEATNAQDQLYGADRMIEALNRDNPDTPEEVLGTIHKDVNAFVKEAAQFDDLTMLCLKYFGPEENG